MNLQNNYPQEHLIELSGLSPYLVGRIVIMESGNFYNVEIDIVQSESGKIHSHVRTIYNEPDSREALDLSVQYLKNFLDAKKH